MTDLAKLVVRLEAQTAEFQKSLEKSNQQLSKFRKNTESGLGAIKSSFSKMQKALGTVGIAASLAVVTTGLTRAALAAIDFGDEVNKAVSRTGVSAEAFSELAYAAKQNDIELTALSTAFKKMQQAVSNANSGAKQSQEIFSALQINFAELRKMSPDKQFELIAEQISRIQDPADKTRAAVELFGRSGADLLPLFEQGAEGIRMAREEAERMGATLTGEQAAMLGEADDAIKRLGQAWDGVTRSLVLGLAPGLTAVLDATNNVLAKEPKVYSFAQAWEAVGRAFDKKGFGTKWSDIINEMQSAEESLTRTSTGTRLPPGGRNRRASPIAFELPQDDSKANGAAARAAAAAAAAAERERLEVLQAEADAYKNVLDAGLAAIDGLKTPVEQQIQQYQETKYALEELARTYPALASEAQAALKRLEMEGLEDITITAEKIFPEPEREKLSVFWEEAARNFQGLLADFLFNPFEDGIQGMLKSFADMLQRMAAEAVAAQIAQKIFGTGAAGGGGLGGGLLDSLSGVVSSALGAWTGGGAGGFLSSIFGGKMSGLGDIPITAQRIPFAGGRATGGPVLAGHEYMVGERGKAERFVPFVNGTIQPVAERAMSVVNNFVIQAPEGSVSRATQMQIGAAAARGLSSANRRNN